MQILYKEGTKRVSYIKTTIKSKDLVEEKGKDRLANLLRYYVESFIEKELNKANELNDYAKNIGVDISNAFIINHNNGEALCYVNQYSKDIEVKPFISISSPNLLQGWTFETGHFSDVDIYLNDGSCLNDYMVISCQDLLNEHTLFLHWVISHVEEDFYSTKEVKSYEKTENYLKTLSVSYRPYNDYKKFCFLSKNVEDIVNKNKSIRMDRLENDGLSPLEYILKNHIFKYANSQNEIFKMCFYFGKPYNQVKNYIEKHSPF